VRTAAAPKLGAYGVLVALGLLGSLAAGRPEPAVLALPFALVVLVGLLRARAPSVELVGRLASERALEGETAMLELTLVSDAPVERLELMPALPPGLAPAAAAPPVSLSPGERRVVAIPLRCERWGAHAIPPVRLRSSGPLGVLAFEQQVELGLALKVFPRPEALRRLVGPRETRAYAGAERARAAGDGIEFAGIRPFLPGDRVRRVNWRVSGRRGALWVNEQHPERNTDVVLFLDAFAEAGRPGNGTFDLAVRASAALAERYLERADRVGLVSFGGYMRSLLPSTGTRQLYRIVDALLDTQIVVHYAWKGVEVIPRRSLPPGALVVAVTPLLDERSIRALLDLPGRGYDVVIEVSPVPLTPLAPTPVGRVAHRVWRLEREELRARLRAAGASVVEWRPPEPLAAAMEEVRTSRRSARRVRV